MKVRDSGMPDEEMWTGFFNPASVLATLRLDGSFHDIVEFGCGYGTFTLAAAAIVTGAVHALDIEPEMITIVRQKCHDVGLRNVKATIRDFVAIGTGLDDNSMDAALLFNILHHVDPVILDVIERMFSYFKVRILRATSATTALDTLRHSPCKTLVTALDMQDMVGTELARRAHEICPDLNIVLFIANSTEQILKLTLEPTISDISEVPLKPYNFGDMLLDIRYRETGKVFLLE